MFKRLMGGLAAGIGGALLGSFLGGSRQPSGPQHSPVEGPGGGLFSTDANTIGFNSTMQGAHVPDNTPRFGAMSGILSGVGRSFASGLGSAGAGAAINSLLGTKSASSQGSDARKYLESAFPGLNPWELAGAGGSGVGQAAEQAAEQKKLMQMEFANQRKLVAMQNDTAKEIAGIQSVTSLRNTKEQVYAQNEMLGYQQRESEARADNILHNSNLSQAQKTHEIVKIILTKAEIAGQNLTNAQIAALTKRVSHEISRLDADTQKIRRETGLLDDENLLTKAKIRKTHADSNLVDLKNVETGVDIDNKLRHKSSIGKLLGDIESSFSSSFKKKGDFYRELVDKHKKSEGISGTLR